MIPLLVKSWVDARYFIAGRDNGFKEELDKLIRELKIEDRIFYLGFISWDDKLSALQNSDFLIVSSFVENFPAVPLEAMSSWIIPIVNNAWGMIEQVKNKKNWIIVDFSNKDNYKKLLNIWILSQDLRCSVEKYKRKYIAEEYLAYKRK